MYKKVKLNQGFSFLEVLGAMVILSMSMVVLMENQSRSLHLTQKALRLDQATSLAISKMSLLILENCIVYLIE